MQLDQNFKDWVLVTFQAAGIVGAMTAAGKVLYEFQEGRKQRAAELRWRRASAAKEGIEVIHKNPDALAAITMMDFHDSKRVYKGPDGSAFSIAYGDVLAALSVIPGEAWD